VPKLDDLLCFREEAMTSHVEQGIVMTHRAADATDIIGIFLDHCNRRCLLGQTIGGGQTGRSGSDNEDINMG
jgi:hypothetical protein